MTEIFFKDKLIGELSDIILDTDLWYSANIKISEYGKELTDFFAVLLNENASNTDIELLNSELLYDDCWYIVDSGENVSIEIPAIYFEENTVMWRKK